MKSIGIFTLPLDEEHGNGIRTYTYNLIKNLLKIDKENKYITIHRKKTNLFGEQPNLVDYVIEEKKFFSKIYFYEKILKDSNKFDLIHGTHAGVPFGKFKKVITIHDIYHTIGLYPKFSFANAKFRVVTPVMMKISDRIIADSYNTKKDIIKFYNVDEEKIDVIHLGVENKEINEEKLVETKKKLN